MSQARVTNVEWGNVAPEDAGGERFGEGYFLPRGTATGPYTLQLQAQAGGLVLRARDPDGRLQVDTLVPLSPFNRASADYAAALETLDAARRGTSSTRAEAAERGARSLCLEGAAMLRDRLRDDVDIDSTTARSLFLLIHALIVRNARVL